MKRILSIALSLLLLCSMSSCQLYNIVTTSKEEYANHCYLSGRNYGTCKKLMGNVKSLVFFVNDTNDTWSEPQKQEYLSVHKTALDNITAQAHSMQVALDFKISYSEIAIDYDCSLLSPEVVEAEVLSALKASSIKQFGKDYLKQYPADQLSITFVFNQHGLSYSYLADSVYPKCDEYSVIFRECGEVSVATIMHEILHQFGAMDYYSLEAACDAATLYLSGSIMNIGYEEEQKIDSLTAYTIGWVDSLDQNAKAFLSATSDITYDQMLESWEDSL